MPTTCGRSFSSATERKAYLTSVYLTHSSTRRGAAMGLSQWTSRLSWLWYATRQLLRSWLRRLRSIGPLMRYGRLGVPSWLARRLSMLLGPTIVCVLDGIRVGRTQDANPVVS